MKQGVLCKRIYALSVCCAILSAAVTLHSLGAEKPKAIPAAEVDQLVISALLHQGIMKPTVISHIDLTKPFDTDTQWTFVAIQEGGQPPTQIAQIEEYGPILVCLVKGSTPDCDEHFYENVSTARPWFDTPYHLLASGIVEASGDKAQPLLLVKTCTAESFNGNCGVATALYRYDRPADSFSRVFLNVTGRNNNEETRFVQRGPLQGDVIVVYPTEHAPYTYWVEVYRARQPGQYIRILRYRGHTGYSDGNPLAVADSEMPEILRQLGFWRRGDVLPVPAHMPKGCSDLFMRRDEEWCK